MIAPLDSVCDFPTEYRASKRVKLSPRPNADTEQDESADPASIGVRHALGVRPSGNAYLSSHNLKDAAGYFAMWPDELIATFLEGRTPRELLALGSTCKALHAFTRNEELWRAIFTS